MRLDFLLDLLGHVIAVKTAWLLCVIGFDASAHTEKPGRVKLEHWKPVLLS